MQAGNPQGRSKRPEIMPVNGLQELSRLQELSGSQEHNRLQGQIRRLFSSNNAYMPNAVNNKHNSNALWFNVASSNREACKRRELNSNSAHRSKELLSNVHRNNVHRSHHVNNPVLYNQNVKDTGKINRINAKAPTGIQSGLSYYDKVLAY
jgi:hypothetical protein